MVRAKIKDDVQAKRRKCFDQIWDLGKTLEILLCPNAENKNIKRYVQDVQNGTMPSRSWLSISGF